MSGAKAAASEAFSVRAPVESAAGPDSCCSKVDCPVVDRNHERELAARIHELAKDVEGWKRLFSLQETVSADQKKKLAERDLEIAVQKKTVEVLAGITKQHDTKSFEDKMEAMPNAQKSSFEHQVEDTHKVILAAVLVIVAAVLVIVAAAVTESRANGVWRKLRIHSDTADPVGGAGGAAPAGVAQPGAAVLAGSVAEVVQGMANDLDQMRGHRLCLVCLAAQKEYLAVPCGHAVWCATCRADAAAVGQLSTCPVCRANIQIVQRMYL